MKLEKACYVDPSKAEKEYEKYRVIQDEKYIS